MAEKWMRTKYTYRDGKIYESCRTGGADICNVSWWLKRQGFTPINSLWEQGKNPNIPLRVAKSGRIYRKQNYRFNFTH